MPADLPTFWMAAHGDGRYVVGQGDNEITRPLPRETALLLKAAPDLLAACLAATRGEPGWAKRIHAAMEAAGVNPTAE